MRHPWIKALRVVPAPIRKLIIFVIGGTVLLYGIAAIVLPGPATLIIPAGLAILAIEFAWAQRLLRKAQFLANSATDKIGLRPFFRRRSSPSAPASTPGSAPCNGAPSATRDDRTRTPGA